MTKSLRRKKRFLRPRRGSNPQPFDGQWDALTIELPRLRWRANVKVRHAYCLSSSHDISILLNTLWFFECGNCENVLFRSENIFLRLIWAWRTFIHEYSLSSLNPNINRKIEGHPFGFYSSVKTLRRRIDLPKLNKNLSLNIFTYVDKLRHFAQSFNTMYKPLIKNLKTGHD